MRKYRTLLKKYLSEYIPAFRKKQRMSQQEMAEKLHISTRAYGDLERGKYCSSAVSLLFLFLMFDPADEKVFLEGFHRKVNDLDGKEGG